ncbi:MAG: hypothetical protein PVI31_02810 [Gemmatimonadota bacterium]
MTRVGWMVAVAAALVLSNVPAQAQFVLRDDTGGWGWLALTPSNRAVVQLVFGSPQTGEQGRLDRRVLDELRSRGVRRLWAFEDFEPTESQVLAECAAVDYTPANSDQKVYAIHTEVSYWDHTRLAATEIYEGLGLSGIAPSDLATDTFVDACVNQLGPVLIRLGYDEG